jgi:hypothetical protein
LGGLTDLEVQLLAEARSLKAEIAALREADHTRRPALKEKLRLVRAEIQEARRERMILLGHQDG